MQVRGSSGFRAPFSLVFSKSLPNLAWISSWLAKMGWILMIHCGGLSTRDNLNFRHKPFIVYFHMRSKWLSSPWLGTKHPAWHPLIWSFGINCLHLADRVEVHVSSCTSECWMTSKGVSIPGDSVTQNFITGGVCNSDCLHSSSKSADFSAILSRLFPVLASTSFCLICFNCFFPLPLCVGTSYVGVSLETHS